MYMLFIIMTYKLHVKYRLNIQLFMLNGLQMQTCV